MYIGRMIFVLHIFTTLILPISVTSEAFWGGGANVNFCLLFIR